MTPSAADQYDSLVEVAVTLGPACRPWIALGQGRHGVGRSPLSKVTINDPSLELHHAVLDVKADGTVTFTQLTGRVPARIDGEPCTPATDIGLEEELVLGSSQLAVRPARVRIAPSAPLRGSLVAADHDPWRQIVRRAPVHAPPLNEPAFAIPQEPGEHRRPPATGLIGAAVAVAGAGVMAILFGQPMFALLALFGAVASAVSWVVGAVSARRSRRSGAATYRAQTEAFHAALHAAHCQQRAVRIASHRTVTDVITGIESEPGRVWEHRLEDSGQMVATIGLGRSRWRVPMAADDRSALAPEAVVELERCEVLPDVPVTMTLTPSTVTALHGQWGAGAALVRSIVVQLAAKNGPADWRLVVISSQPEQWKWATWLPHAQLRSADSLVVAAADAAAVAATLESLGALDERPVLIVVDDPTLLSVRTGPLRRYLATSDAACMVIVPSATSVPALCRRVLVLGSTGGAEWQGELPESDYARGVQVAGIDAETAQHVARRVAALIDPEDPDASDAGVPTNAQLADIGLSDQLGPVAARLIARRWAAGGLDPAPRAAVGVSADGIVDIDLVRDGPHGLIAGTTGSGKSEFLRTLVVSLAAEVGPDHLTFVLVDYKGGSTFDGCGDLPHTVGLVTDLDEGLAERALVSLEAELTRRERALRSVGAGDLSDYRASPDVGPLPRLVVVIDEFAALAKELPDFLNSLVGIAQRGRSLGIHLLLATQRPAGVVNDDIRANTNMRLALRLNDTADANDVVGDELPATFPRAVPGRAVLKLGPDELIVFQAARCTGQLRESSDRLRIVVPDLGEPGAPVSEDSAERAGFDELAATTELDAMVVAMQGAAAIHGGPPPHRPWLEPLPKLLDHDAVDAIVREGRAAGVPPGERDADDADSDDADSEKHDAVGLVDDPARQARAPLRWDSTAGNLLLVGSLGAGTTSTLVAIAAAQCRVAGPDECHVYVIDARGEPSLDGLASVAHCGAVVRVHESERLDRLARRLNDEIDRRSIDADRGRRVLLFIDGLGSLRSRLGTVDDAPTLELLDRVMQDGPAVGIAVCSTTDGSSSAAMTASASQRWVFHVDDPSIATSLGARGAPIPDEMPGRLRVVETSLLGQVAHGAAGLADLPHRVDGVGPAAVEVLPERVEPAALMMMANEDDDAPNATSLDGEEEGLCQLVLGRQNTDLEPAVLQLPFGDHMFIGGSARTGKSTALRQVEAAWRAVRPTGNVVYVGRKMPLEPDHLSANGGAAGGETLVVIDDADRVDDPTGELVEILAGHRPGVTIAAAARLDSVRTNYGHWAREVTRSRCGLILVSPGDIDGDLLGATLPQRSRIPPRPGLAWMIDGRGNRLVQVADRMRE